MGAVNDGNSDGDLDWLFDTDDDFNKPDPTLIRDFHPRRDELLVLVKHYQARILDGHYDWFAYRMSCSREICFAQMRIAQIAKCVGDPAVDESCRRATEDFAKSIDPDTWRIFTEGTDEERAAFREEVALLLQLQDIAARSVAQDDTTD